MTPGQQRRRDKAVKLQRLILDLPDTADDIAALLQVQGMVGVGSSYEECPLALYFQRNGVEGASVGMSSVGFRGYEMPLPIACENFVTRFDKGEWPALVKKETE